ncbi:CubicO group peptidase (beta-lactamase class C family) [Saonia flava]|uniref:CubicO group peptidase (Beta-lactamase class C family) n=1 Tax=Saonia flava TaxID=523696 RepID=A0A846QU46_9FLAO|nr:serine hydrolase domain-containing protein [Saonia flava]NJB71741.1 CubicO group peptidase (beta-lactamase class C family) [Saonia flava]
MKRLLTIFLSLFALVTFAQTKSVVKSPPLSEGSPISLGMSPERLDRIDTMLKESINSGDVPGAIALVARNGKIVYHKAFGMADNESGRVLKRDDIFRIASQTKAITATAVMMLWEEGKFRLDDPIENYIPEFKNGQVLDTYSDADGTYTTTPVSTPITIRHLLTHTSGIGYGVIDGDERFKKIYDKAGVTDLFTTKNISIEESVKKLAKLPLHHNPGEKFTYSEGLDVLGYFIEIVSGMPFDEFFRTRIFDPLEMKDTWFYLPKEKHSRLVSVQHKVDGKWKKYPVTFYDTNYPITGAKRFFSGGAGLSSTVKDYATFLQMYLNGGELNGVRILSRKTIETMMGLQFDNVWDDKGSHYGLAYRVVNQTGQNMGAQGSIGTFSWGGYFNTQYFADPKEKIIGIIFKQTQGPTTDQTRWKFSQLVWSSIDD